MVRTETFDAARYLTSADSQAELIADAVESGDPTYVAHALGVVAKARGMTAVAREAGMTREGLYKALSEDGNPSFATIAKVARALGYRVRLEVA